MAKAKQQNNPDQQQLSPTNIFKTNLKSGVVFGAIAYILNYIITYVFVTLDGIDVSPTPIPVWKIVGYVFYTVQQSTIEATEVRAGETQTETVDIFYGFGFNELTSTVPQILYQIAPVIVLIGAGYYSYQQAQKRSLSTEAAAALAATIVGGYGIMTIVGTFLFTFERAAVVSVTIGPALIESIIFVGLLYPVICGGIGGIIANR